MTEPEARALLGSLSAEEARALATLARLVDADVRRHLAELVEEACRSGHEQRVVADLTARGGRVHRGLMSLPRLAGR